MTRFRIVQRHKISVAYEIQLKEVEAVIPVKRPSLSRALMHYEVNWTWMDNTQYVLEFPMMRGPSIKPWWHITSGGQNISSGCRKIYNLGQLIARREFPRIEWELEGEVVISETRSACFGLNVLRRQRDGKRLACWHYKNGFGLVAEGICRNSLPKENFPVILGMIMTELEEKCRDWGSSGGD